MICTTLTIELSDESVHWNDGVESEELSTGVIKLIIEGERLQIDIRFVYN